MQQLKDKMINKLESLVKKTRGKEQLIAIKCLEIVKDCGVIDEAEFLKKVNEAAVYEFGNKVISIEKLLRILDEMKETSKIGLCSRTRSDE